LAFTIGSNRGVLIYQKSIAMTEDLNSTPVKTAGNCMICPRPDATAEELDVCADSENEAVLRAVVTHPNTSLRTLDKLLLRTDLFPVALALANKLVPLSRVDSFVVHWDPAVRNVVATRTESKVSLRQLARDPVDFIRTTATNNWLVDTATIHQVAVDDKSLVLVVEAVKRLREVKILEKVALRLADTDWEDNSHDNIQQLANAIGGHIGFTELSNDAKARIVEVKLQSMN
jgi:hypothetical protein